MRAQVQAAYGLGPLEASETAATRDSDAALVFQLRR
jgi:hypothetical protein